MWTMERGVSRASGTGHGGVAAETRGHRAREQGRQEAEQGHRLQDPREATKKTLTSDLE